MLKHLIMFSGGIGFVSVESDMGPTYDDHFEIKVRDGTLNIWELRDGLWVLQGMDWAELTTRHQLLSLLSALGVETKGAK